jgi:hypothetical protein
MRVAIDRLRGKEDLEIPHQVRDYEQHQDKARDRHDNLSADRRIEKAGDAIHSGQPKDQNPFLSAGTATNLLGDGGFRQRAPGKYKPNLTLGYTA